MASAVRWVSNNRSSIFAPSRLIEPFNFGVSTKMRPVDCSALLSEIACVFAGAASTCTSDVAAPAELVAVVALLVTGAGVGKK